MRIDSTRERRPTAGFGWVDHRIVRGGHLAALSQAGAAVYLVLCVVADRKGVSYYSPTRLGELVKHSATRVEEALEELAERGLIAREGRFAQVVPLEAVGRAPESSGKRPGVDTKAGLPPAPTGSMKPEPESAPEPATESAVALLASLPAAEREALMERARQKLRPVTGSREPSLAVVLAIAAGLLREERG